MKSNTAQSPLAPAVEEVQPIQSAELKACFNCEHYDPCGPHDISRRERILIRCRQKRRLGEKGLTPVVDSLNDCEARKKTTIYLRR